MLSLKYTYVYCEIKNFFTKNIIPKSLSVRDKNSILIRVSMT